MTALEPSLFNDYVSCGASRPCRKIAVPSPTYSSVATAPDDASLVDVYILRHGERVDETSMAEEFWTTTKRSRHFDPPLTEKGEEQARTAARTILRMTKATRGGGSTEAPLFDGVFISPMMRCLKTAQVVCEEMHNELSGVRPQEEQDSLSASMTIPATVSPVFEVCPGLSECAAVIRRHGVHVWKWLQETEMRALSPPGTALPYCWCKGSAAESEKSRHSPCTTPPVSHYYDASSAFSSSSSSSAGNEGDTETNADGAAGGWVAKVSRNAPDTYMDCVEHLVQHYQNVQRSDGATEEAAEREKRDEGVGSRKRILLVSHREGIRDITGNPRRLPYCAIAQFRVGFGPQSGDSSAEKADLQWELLNLLEPVSGQPIAQ